MADTPLSSTVFTNRLLDIMEHKHHWAWPHFAGPTVTRAQLKIHFQQEYAVYVRDFPVFLARIHGHNPPLDVRKMLAENIYEEDTGQLSLGTSHPELFIRMMKGLKFRPHEFANITLLPSTVQYRAWLDQISDSPDWVLGAAVMTIFVEGSVNDRRELRRPARPKSQRDIQSKIDRHPLVQFHQVPPQAMDLIRAHQMVEGGHRHDAYAMVVHHAKQPAQQRAVLKVMEKSLRLWLQYRDGVARACGLQKPGRASARRVAGSGVVRPGKVGKPD